jgi:hypothetical protein
VARGVDDLVDRLDLPGTVGGRARVEAAGAVVQRRVPRARVMCSQLRRSVMSPALVILGARPEVSPAVAELFEEVGVPHGRVAGRRFGRKLMPARVFLAVAAVATDGARAPQRVLARLIPDVAHSVPREVGVDAEGDLVDHLFNVSLEPPTGEQARFRTA